MAHSSRTKSSVSIDLFNLPPLPDTRRQSTMQCEISNDFFLPDGKNTQLTKIVNTWTFNRLTPNGNEGVGVQIDYLEHAYGTRYYFIDKVNGQINAIHDDSLELTGFKGHFSPFDLDNLKSKVCRLSIGDKYEEDVFESQDMLPKDVTQIQIQEHKTWKSTKVWVSMRITTAQYHQLVELHHNREQQDRHQHQNQW